MPINKDFEELFHLLNSAHAKYLMVGAYAVIHYTEPRYTKDIDIWVEPGIENAKKTYQALKKFGAPLGHLTLKDLTNPKMVYQIGVEPNRIDILMGIGKLPFRAAWKNRRETRYGKERISVIDLKDLIRAKRIAGRPHDQSDLEILKQAVRLHKKKR